MSKNCPPDQILPTANANENNTDTRVGGEPVSAYGSTRRPTRADNRHVNMIGTTRKYFEGYTPKISGVLGFRNENVPKNYDLS